VGSFPAACDRRDAHLIAAILFGDAIDAIGENMRE
jgi:hypothetical protein